jgi:hypothetical protein
VSEPERDPQAKLEIDVDARHFGDDVRVGVAYAVIHLDTVDDVAGARGHGFGQGAGCAGDGEGADCARRQQESACSRPQCSLLRQQPVIELE